MTTWILVGDASRADIYTANGGDDSWNLVEHFNHEESRHLDHELSPTEPGHSAQSKGGARRTTFEPRTSPQEVEKEHFAHELAGYLEKAVTERAFEELWLVAPPHFLGLLRASLSEEVSRRVRGTHHHDYRFASAKEAREQLTGVVFS